MKAALIAGFLACAAVAAPVAQWNNNGGFSVSTPLGGFSVGPNGLRTDGPLGGVSISTNPPRNGGGYNNYGNNYGNNYCPSRDGCRGRGWHTDAAEEAETAEPKEAAAEESTN